MGKIKKPDFIFVGGMPRSGTSLIGQLTSQSDDVFSTVTDISIFNYLPKVPFATFKVSSSEIENIVDFLLTKTHVSKWQLETSEVVSITKERTITNWYDLSICFFIAIQKKFQTTIYIKSPGLEFYFGEIERLLPKDFSRKYVFIVRNPINAYLSMKYAGLAWRGKQDKIVDQSMRWAFRWKQSFNLYLLNKEVLNGNIILIKHEDNVKNRKATFTRLFDYLGLELTDKVLNHNNRRQSSVEGHSEIKRELTKTESKNITDYCFDYMKLLKYIPDSENPTAYTNFRATEIHYENNTDLLKIMVKKLLKREI